SAKDKIVDEPEEQRVSPVKSGRGKGFMCYGDQVVNVPNKLKKDIMPRKTRSLTIAEETVVDLSDDNPNGDDDATRFGVFMYNKFTETPKSTYFSPTITSSSLDFIHNLLNETPANELTYFVSNLVYTDAQTTSAVIYPEGNPELTSYILGASEVPLGTHVNVQATKILLQEMFSNENARRIPSLPAKKIP
ncbi:hypothetical protein Tco_0933496, partial [Tanacetum coccineum]